MKRPLAYRPLNTPLHCDVCGRPRNNGNHQKCSKVRQAMHATQNDQQRSGKL